MKGYLLLQIRQIIRETPHAATFVLESTDGSTVHYRAGQFLTLIFERQGKEVRRSFSLSSTPGVDQDLRITVKQMENGEISRYMLSKLKIGDRLKALFPAGRFVFPESFREPGDVFLLAAGSGIVPVFSILKMLLHTPADLKITLIYSNYNEKNTIFREEINALARAHSSRFRCLHLLSRPHELHGPGARFGGHHSPSGEPYTPSAEHHNPPGELYNPSGERYSPSAEPHNRPEELNEIIQPSEEAQAPVEMIQGHLNNQLLEQLLAKHLHFERSKALFFICGPFTYMRMAQITLRVNGFSEEQLYKENFIVNEPVPPRFTFPPGPYPKEVLFNVSGKIHRLQLTQGQTVLDAALQQGMDLPYSCKAGVCATCIARCFQGEIKMAVNEVLTKTDLERGLILTCVAYPVTEKVNIEIEL